MQYRRVDPRFYQLMGEALPTVEHALQEVRRCPQRSEMQALSDAIKHYARLCEEWRRMISAKDRV